MEKDNEMSDAWRMYINTSNTSKLNELSKLLDSDLQLKELTETVQQLSTGKASGFDGLPAELFKQF